MPTNSPALWIPLLLATLGLALTGCPEPEGPTDGPTYYTDVHPILETHCVRCHFDGGLGTGDFSDLDTVLALGEAMVAQLDSGQMPPPASDPECRDYAGSEHLVLPEADRDTIRAWVDAGKQVGDPADVVAGDPLPGNLPDADLEVLMEADYTPRFDDPAFPGNEYRCFVLDNPRDELFYVTSMAPLIGELSIAHHAVVSRIPDNANLPPHDPAEGFECREFDILQGLLGAWAPGMLPIELPEGHGLPVQPDEDLIVQMHYFESEPGAELPDRSGYEFVTADSVDKTVFNFAIGSFNWTIPAGDDAYSYESSLSLADLGVPLSVNIFGVFPHMHVLGAGWRYWLEHDDGSTTCLSESDRYDFDNQMTYVWNDPPKVRPTDRIHFECTWNNSTSNDQRLVDPPQDTTWGEGSDQEMCFFFTYGALAD